MRLFQYIKVNIIIVLMFTCFSATGQALSDTLSNNKKNILKEGIYVVDVAMTGSNFLTRRAVKTLKSKSKHYIKLTTTDNGTLRVQFCNEKGEVSGNNETTDYHYKTTNHFWANKMPMALNLYDVDIRYNPQNGCICKGTSVKVYGRDNKNPKGFVPFFLNRKKVVTQSSGSKSDIIKTCGNSADSFTIEIVLDFKKPFHCVISKK